MEGDLVKHQSQPFKPNDDCFLSPLLNPFPFCKKGKIEELHYYPQSLASELIEGLIELRGHIQAGLSHSAESDRQKPSSNEEMQGIAALSRSECATPNMPHWLWIILS